MDAIFDKEYNVIDSNWKLEKIRLKNIISESEKTLLYFYPKDNTPWCTLENKDFSCLKWKFNNLWIQLIWVSKDTIEDHKKFILEHQLWNTLISDEDLELHKLFFAYWEKNNYGKIFLGIIRTTVLLDRKCNILKTRNNIKATGHAERLLKELSV